MSAVRETDVTMMRLALRLARRGHGATSPNPMVGAVLVNRGRVIGRGWHRQAGGPHAEIEALRDAQKRGHNPKGATLYVTLEPCCTHGRTPPCTGAITAVGIKRVVIGATDPNPKHAGRGFRILKRAGIEVVHGILADECARLNESFNHWIVERTPFVTVKAAMTLDGKIATADGESKWITGPIARAHGMKLRKAADAILVGVNTVLADDPSLTVRAGTMSKPVKLIRRFVLDSMARTPLTAKVVSDHWAATTTIVVSADAPRRRVEALSQCVRVMTIPGLKSRIGLRRLLREMGHENIANLLVEGGGEVNAAFLMGGFAHRAAFFYAPKILGGAASRRGVAGDGATKLSEALQLTDVEWKKFGDDLLMTARVLPR